MAPPIKRTHARRGQAGTDAPCSNSPSPVTHFSWCGVEALFTVSPRFLVLKFHPLTDIPKEFGLPCTPQPPDTPSPFPEPHLRHHGIGFKQLPFVSLAAGETSSGS
ncbi:hypothetical protein JZ751_013340 [Albula glossodonta]|uniref:Uncharacterized protein n=1 Tax=Albula glossodonta TaxID=121402 RepID=A0A8T2NXU0_9TELE|nr:hypothetical protein JZ751_013340 [Albula glossodonta]